MTTNRHNTRTAGTLLVAALLLSACSSTESADASPEVREAPQNPPSPAVVSESAAPPAVDSPPAELKLKGKFPYTSPDGEQLTAQVLAHKKDDGVEAADVKVCNTGTITFTASRSPWVLLYGGGDSEHNVDISGGGLPAPAYPDSFNPKTLTPGKCARGWVNWTSIDGKRPYGVTYKVEGTPAVWKF